MYDVSIVRTISFLSWLTQSGRSPAVPRWASVIALTLKVEQGQKIEQLTDKRCRRSRTVVPRNTTSVIWQNTRLEARAAPPWPAPCPWWFRPSARSRPCHRTALSRCQLFFRNLWTNFGISFLGSKETSLPTLKTDFRRRPTSHIICDIDFSHRPASHKCDTWGRVYSPTSHISDSSSMLLSTLHLPIGTHFCFPNVGWSVGWPVPHMGRLVWTGTLCLSLRGCLAHLLFSSSALSV